MKRKTIKKKVKSIKLKGTIYICQKIEKAIKYAEYQCIGLPEVRNDHFCHCA